MTLPLLVIDDFLPDPVSVRNSSIASGFGSWRPNKGAIGSSVYDGVNFYGDHASVVEAIYKKIGIIGFPNSMSFRVTNETTERAYVHSDNAAGHTTCIVYLSHHEDKYGTGFYRNKRTGSLVMPPVAALMADPKEMALSRSEMNDSGEQFWHEEEFVQGKFNRAVIFKSDRYHRRFPEHGFGTNPEDGRMIHISHYKDGQITC